VHRGVANDGDCDHDWSRGGRHSMSQPLARRQTRFAADGSRRKNRARFLRAQSQVRGSVSVRLPDPLGRASIEKWREKII
jgi:hypothetical protein